MRTSNPIINSNTLYNVHASGAEAMTVNGAVQKTLYLALILTTGAAITWWMGVPGMALSLLGLIGGLIAAIVLIFKREWAPTLAPVYALCEGLALGGISMMFERSFPGIAFQAVGMTIGVLFCMIGLYKSRIIKVTDSFRMGVVSATGGIAIFYLISMVAGLFGFPMTFLNGSGPLSIGISLLIVGVAALNLVLDFDSIDQAAQHQLPKYMEWFLAFGLMVTLVWLYLEMLRLLSKFQRRD
jgi:uncharacterized YccA/Bax inhibitor family protein